MTHSVNTARLLISCPDQKGIIAAVAGFVADQGGNILEADQHTDPQHAEFFMRVEIELSGFGLHRRTFEEAWTPVAEAFQMQWRVYWGDETKRMAVLVSKEGHCLSDLLWRWKTDELRVDIPLVVSNHLDLRDHVEACERHSLSKPAARVAFHHLPVTNKTRNDQEHQLSELLVRERIDFIVLARYMQVLSPSFVAQYAERAINIHHSFLPAFAGPQPYHQAFERGVKIIGATSHYVTDALDQGPIIAQATTPVDHRDTLEDLIRKGRDLERVVLAEAVRSHIEDEILVSQNKTVVFH